MELMPDRYMEKLTLNTLKFMQVFFSVFYRRPKKYLKFLVVQILKKYLYLLVTKYLKRKTANFQTL